jgi:hypothetical protein
MVVALMALIVALGGTAYAVQRINGKLVKKGSLPADRIKRHSITGTQMNLKRLGKVPTAAAADSAGIAGTANLAKNADNATKAFLAQKATNADSAGNANTIAGTNMARMFAKLSSGPATKTLLDTGFVKIVAGCGGGNPSVTATSEADHQEAQFGMVNGGGPNAGSNSNWSSNATMDLAAGASNGAGNFAVAAPDGRVLTVNYSFDSGSVFGGPAGCSVTGTASWG